MERLQVSHFLSEVEQMLAEIKCCVPAAAVVDSTGVGGSSSGVFCRVLNSEIC